jgi:hypothetical protein
MKIELSKVEKEVFCKKNNLAPGNKMSILMFDRKFKVGNIQRIPFVTLKHDESGDLVVTQNDHGMTGHEIKTQIKRSL